MVSTPVSVLFNEPKLLKSRAFGLRFRNSDCFSALQRAEIAEIGKRRRVRLVLRKRFSALQRAEIAEIAGAQQYAAAGAAFQCSSTSRNC